MDKVIRWGITVLLAMCWTAGAGCSKQPARAPAVATRVPARDVVPSGKISAKEGPPVRSVYAKPGATQRVADVAPHRIPPQPAPAREASASGAAASAGSSQPTEPGKKPPATKARLPEVVLTAGHAALCRVGVGDQMPPITLPDLDGQQQELAGLYGKNLTVVCFWKGDRALARAELADLGPDIVAPYAKRGVTVVGIAVQEPAAEVRRLVPDQGTAFVNLLDADGKALAKVGTGKLPRTYLLDRSGTILWFDIEYSRSTRRELLQSIRASLSAP